MNQDFLDLLSAFNAAEVRYLVVGAYAAVQEVADVHALERLRGLSAR